MRINTELKIGNRYRILYSNGKMTTRTLKSFDDEALIFSGELIFDECSDVSILPVVKAANYTGSKWNN
jgi:hypothetical protein